MLLQYKTRTQVDLQCTVKLSFHLNSNCLEVSYISKKFFKKGFNLIQRLAYSEEDLKGGFNGLVQLPLNQILLFTSFERFSLKTPLAVITC